MNGVPEEKAGLFAAMIRPLVASECLHADALVSVTDLPSEVQLTDGGRSVVNYWPGAEPAELSEDLIAAIDDQEQNEPDPKRKRLLEAVATTIKETGVATVSETLSKVITGGM
jgi:hypothetical protein